nr:putative DNA-binding domain-containing protein [uncultured Roseateles sp.]
MIAAQQALLAAIQAGNSAIAQVLLAGTAWRALPGLGVADGLQAYRRNAQALAARSLAAVHPLLLTELGRASFDSLAWAFWRASPPSQGDLGAWGQALPEFLAAQPGVEAWLCDLARLGWARHVAERAADSRLDVDSLNLLQSQSPELMRLRLRPGLSLLHLLPQACGLNVDLPRQPLLVWREGWRAEQQILGAGDAALMGAMLQGLDLDRALQEALAAAPDFDFGAWLQQALQRGWLHAVETLAPVQADAPGPTSPSQSDSNL